MGELVMAAILLLGQGMMLGGMLVWVLLEVRFARMEKMLRTEERADAVREEDHRKGD